MKRRRNIYRTIKVPMPLIKKIDKIIKMSNGEYTSRSDFTKDAIRTTYSKYLKQYQEDKKIKI